MQSRTLSANVSDPKAFGRVGWSVVAVDSAIEATDRRDLNSNSIRGSALLQIDPQLQMRLIVGSEANNYRTVDSERSTITGVALDWMASPRRSSRASGRIASSAPAT
jgi:uncharacterized protein (PEP-CTERM system associated)